MAKAVITKLKRNTLSDFIEIFKDEISIWNSEHPYYFNYERKYRAYARLRDKLQEDYKQATETDAKNVYNYLRSTFKRNLLEGNMKNDKAIERVVKKYPEFWYLKHLMFLEPVFHSIAEANSSNIQTDSEDSEDSSSEEEDDSDYSDNSQKASKRRRIDLVLPVKEEHEKNELSVKECFKNELPVKEEHEKKDFSVKECFKNVLPVKEEGLKRELSVKENCSNNELPVKEECLENELLVKIQHTDEGSINEERPDFEIPVVNDVSCKNKELNSSESYDLLGRVEM